MKITYSKLTLFIAAVSLCITINACNKGTSDSDLSTVQDETQVSTESSYIEAAADAGAAQSISGQQQENGGEILPACTGISFANTDTATGPKTMTITFSGCQFPDYKTRTGNIIVTWTGGYHDSGTIIHTYTKGYTINGNTYNYSKWVTNSGRVSGVYTFNVIDTATVTTTKGIISWTSSKTRTWTSGTQYHWWQYWNTCYSIIGSEKGVDRKGVTFTSNVTSPVIVNFGCNWILTGGTYDLQVQGKAERMISFVDGCSGNATCTIQGVTYTFLYSNY